MSTQATTKTTTTRKTIHTGTLIVDALCNSCGKKMTAGTKVRVRRTYSALSASRGITTGAHGIWAYCLDTAECSERIATFQF